MAGNDQLTALDAAFLELEEADDGALMHIGAALVFDPLPGGGRRRSGRCASTSSSAWTCCLATGRSSARPAPAGSPGRRGSAISVLRSRGTFAMRRSRRRGKSPSSWTGSRTSTRIAWIAAVRCGRLCCSTVWRAGVGRWCRRPTIAWSTESARSTLSTCCSARSPRRASPQRPTSRCRTGMVDAWLPHPPEPIGQAAGAASRPLAQGCMR